VITAGVAPSLYVEYKHTGIKQYFKENRALRTETTINDVRDLRNLSPTSIQRLIQPTLTAEGQRAPGLRLADSI
jgi:hypothetical protein